MQHDAPLGPGWWQSVDGRWYPPNTASPRDMSWARLQAAPGWYPDSEPGWYRWWDGGRWTVHRRAADLRMRYPAPADEPGQNRTLLPPRDVPRPAVGGRVAIGFLGLLALGGLAVVSSGGGGVGGGDPSSGGQEVAADDLGVPVTGELDDDRTGSDGETGDVTIATSIPRPEGDRTEQDEAPTASTTAPTTTTTVPPPVPGTAGPPSTGPIRPSTLAPDQAEPESDLREFDRPQSALVEESSTVPPPSSSLPAPPTTAADQACHPSYTPCIEFLPGDALDCGDLRPEQKPVTVRDPDDDPYRLDGDDRDGEGCEAG